MRVGWRKTMAEMPAQSSSGTSDRSRATSSTRAGVGAVACGRFDEEPRPPPSDRPRAPHRILQNVEERSISVPVRLRDDLPVALTVTAPGGPEVAVAAPWVTPGAASRRCGAPCSHPSESTGPDDRGYSGRYNPLAMQRPDATRRRAAMSNARRRRLIRLPQVSTWLAMAVGLTGLMYLSWGVARLVVPEVEALKVLNERRRRGVGTGQDRLRRPPDPPRQGTAGAPALGLGRHGGDIGGGSWPSPFCRRSSPATPICRSRHCWWWPFCWRSTGGSPFAARVA